MNIDVIFYWIGITASVFFVLLGMSAFAGWVMNVVWRKFKDGKELALIIGLWRDSQHNKESDGQNNH
ncbi:MAG: hypothetical protein SV201_04875 [Pseudomonadota bacterium]|nr:hypothetical protein [Pseudomonadota bacterium]